MPPAPLALSTLSVGGATYDIFLGMSRDAVPREDGIFLKAGGKLRVSGVTEAAGGGACNTSVALSRLGMRAGFCGVLGADQWGERLLASMRKENVNVDAATVVEHETSSFSIILSLESGERTILYTPGVNEHLHDVTFDLDAVSSVNAVYLNHLSEASCAIEDDIIRMLVKIEGIKLTWNPGGCQIEHGYDHKDKKALLKRTHLLLLNAEEAIAFTRTKSVEEAMSLLLKTGAKHVVVTDGKRGVLGSDGEHTWHCPVPEGTKVTDTTGAGDAFGSGVTWALLTGHSLPDALVFGTLNAASVVESIGAQAGLLTDTEIQKRMQTSTIEASRVS